MLAYSTQKIGHIIKIFAQVAFWIKVICFVPKWFQTVLIVEYFSVLFSTDKVYTFGRSEYGRLGLGENCTEKKEPTLVKALQDKKIVAIGGGAAVSYAITSEGMSISLEFYKGKYSNLNAYI